MAVVVVMETGTLTVVVVVADPVLIIALSGAARQYGPLGQELLDD
jgi:hypothetical protein